MALMLSQPRIDVDSPVVAVSGFDPPMIRPGEQAVYHITFNALETSIRLSPEIATRPATEVRPAAHGQILALTGTNYQPRTTFNFRVRPSQPGLVTVPRFKVHVYGKPVEVPTAQLQVLTELPEGVPAPMTLKLEVPETNCYVGQAVRVSVTLPPATSLVMQHSSPLQITGEGFIVDVSTLRPRMEMRAASANRGGVPSIAYDLILTPIASGETTAFAQAFVGSRTAGPVPNPAGGTILFLPNYTLVDSEPVKFHVRPLPSEGQLPGFTGGVGTFFTDTPQLATNTLRVGDPVRLIVRVRGEGNLTRLVPPPPPRDEQWRVFRGEPNATHPQIIQAQGFTLFNYTLVPLSAEARATPAIPFSCFDPSEGRYLDCTISPVPVKVLPGAVPADLAVLERAAASAGRAEKEPVLSGLASSPGLGAASLVPLQRRAWFPLLQLAPAAAFLGLWTWDRRRRFYEVHPDVLLRRRARRALHRQWKVMRKAAARRSGADFVSAAVRALDIACSPFYPAEPQALVGADVLALLPESQRSGSWGQAVRQLFDASDAARFSADRQEFGGVLKLEPEINGLLGSLEERLRA